MKNHEHERSVIIVGTDAVTLHPIRDVFFRAGFTVTTAATAWEAQKFLRNAVPDVLLCELKLSDMDGFAFRERLLAEPTTHAMPFIFLGGEGHSEQEIRALRAHVDDYLPRPFDAVVVVTRVQAVIDRRRSYQEVVRLDPLTRLLNRPTLQREVSQDLVRIARYKRISSLVLVKLDMEDLEDTEEARTWGNLYATFLSGAIHLAVRSVDLAGRYTPDQFAVYLPETSAEGAHVVARRIHERFRGMAASADGPKASLSVGIVEAPGEGESLEALVAGASGRLEGAAV